MTFARKLREVKDARQLTHREIAVMCGIPTSSVTNYLSGKFVPEEERRRAMAVSLGLPEDYFVQVDLPLKVARRQKPKAVPKTEKKAAKKDKPAKMIPAELYEQEVRRRKNAEALANEYYRRLVRRGLY